MNATQRQREFLVAPATAVTADVNSGFARSR